MYYDFLCHIVQRGNIGESRPLTETFSSGLQVGEYEYIVQTNLDDAWETIAYAPFIAINTTPEIDSISAQPVPVRIDEIVSVSGIFSDIDIMDIHTATFDWGDGNTSEGEIIETNGNKTAVGNHVYDTSGIYTVTLTVVDDGGLSDQADYPYLIVYDPSGGTVTGGGWIDSPLGAYSADPLITGKANVGFVCKYQIIYAVGNFERS